MAGPTAGALQPETELLQRATGGRLLSIRDLPDTLSELLGSTGREFCPYQPADSFARSAHPGTKINKRQKIKVKGPSPMVTLNFGPLTFDLCHYLIAFATFTAIQSE